MKQQQELWWHYYAYIPNTTGYDAVMQGPFFSEAQALGDIEGRYSMASDDALARYSMPFAVPMWSEKTLEDDPEGDTEHYSQPRLVGSGERDLGDGWREHFVVFDIDDCERENDDLWGDE